jgi:glycosyltransferase involved in cell wall biosynthesis
MRVSVLLPARDAEATLDACLHSVTRQTFEDWECVLVDDGSRDRTAAVAARWQAADARVTVRTLPPVGIVAALEHGLACCRGDLVARMDADDLMHRERLAMQVAALDADDGLAAVGCQVRMFPRQTLTSGRVAYERWLNSLASEADIRRDAFVECPVAHPALMVRRAVLAAAGYRDAGWPEDYDLLLRLLGEGARIGVVPRRLVAWRDSANRLSRRDARYGLDRFTACKAAFLARGFLGASEGYVLWGYGDTGKALARALAEHGRRAVAIVEVHPGRIGQCIAGTPVLGLEALDAFRGTPLVVSVAGAGPRAEIRTHLTRRGFLEGRDYVCAA